MTFYAAHAVLNIRSPQISQKELKVSVFFVHTMHTHKAFTLLEILVSITMISLLTIVVMVNMKPSLAKSRDAKRIERVQDLQKALSLSFISNKSYPVFQEEIVLSSSDPLNETLIGNESISTPISDPRTGNTSLCGFGNTCNMYYKSNQSGTSYQIRFCLETDAVQGSYSKGCTNVLTP